MEFICNRCGATHNHRDLERAAPMGWLMLCLEIPRAQGAMHRDSLNLCGPCHIAWLSWMHQEGWEGGPLQRALDEAKKRRIKIRPDIPRPERRDTHEEEEAHTLNASVRAHLKAEGWEIGWKETEETVMEDAVHFKPVLIIDDDKAWKHCAWTNPPQSVDEPEEDEERVSPRIREVLAGKAEAKPHVFDSGVFGWERHKRWRK